MTFAEQLTDLANRTEELAGLAPDGLDEAEPMRMVEAMREMATMYADIDIALKELKGEK